MHKLNPNPLPQVSGRIEAPAPGSRAYLREVGSSLTPVLDPTQVRFEEHAPVAGQSPITNALTVDVEDYFQVGAFEPFVARSEWSSYEVRVEQSTRRLLDLLAERRARATFFFLGWVAERCPKLVRDVRDLGHEIGAHGWDHKSVTSLTPLEFRQEARRTKRLLEDMTGEPVLGFRAPNFSVNRQTLWAAEILLDEGFVYDCSVREVMRGEPFFPRFPFTMHMTDGRKLVEFPLSTLNVMRRRVPFVGGNYMRQLPRWLGPAGIRHLNQRERRPAVVYVHPWEIDPDQPRVKVDLVTRVRHYRNLGSMFSRLDSLLRAFTFDTAQAVLDVTPQPV